MKARRTKTKAASKNAETHALSTEHTLTRHRARHAVKRLLNEADKLNP